MIIAPVTKVELEDSMPKLKINLYTMIMFAVFFKTYNGHKVEVALL
jgi:hypothetical protein